MQKRDMQLQALYNDDANKMVKKTAQAKISMKICFFLIDPAMVTSDTMLSKDWLQMLNKAWSHPNAES